MSYDISSLQTQQTLDQLESLVYSYEDNTQGLGLWNDDFSCLSADDNIYDHAFLIPADTRGMRALDYQPDTDDFEYQQSLLY